MRRYLVVLALLFLFVYPLLAYEDMVADNPYELKMRVHKLKEDNRPHKIIVDDGKMPPHPVTLSEIAYKKAMGKNPDGKVFSKAERGYAIPIFEKYNLPYPSVFDFPEIASRAVRRSAPPPIEPSDILSPFEFSDHDVLVSIATARPQRQPSIATTDDGWIICVWGEQVGEGTNAIMSSRSTDGGVTFESARIVDDIGVNYMPRVDVYGSGNTAKVHVVYNYIEMQTYMIFDTSGTYLGTDTVYEGDVYYTRSNNGGRTYGHYQTIANNDINLIIFGFTYDENGADIFVDDMNNVYISYYSQADEGHIISVVTWIIWIIVTGGLPPFWWDYTWYKVCMRVSGDGGINFNSQEDVENEWFVDNSYCAVGVKGSGSSATAYVPYTNTGVLSLFGADLYFKWVDDPLGSFSPSDETYIDVGYVIPGGCAAGNGDDVFIGYSQVFSSSDYDVYYAHSSDGGSSFATQMVAVSGADEYEPRLAVDDAGNPFMTWTDARTIDYSIYTKWSEDGGATLRSDDFRVDHDPTGVDQYWPDVSMFLGDSVRRVDFDWWDTRDDAFGDIYYCNGFWWKTILHIMLNDTLAHPMEGTITITYTSAGQLIEREISTGDYIIYHDSATTITLDQMSSGSDDNERWIWSESGNWEQTPPHPGMEYTIVYYDQVHTTFTAEKGNGPACTHTVPTGIPFTYEFFGVPADATTLLYHWADVGGEYHYAPAYPSDPHMVERWYTPEPDGIVMTDTVSPVYYHQWKAEFRTPLKLNDPRCCTHDVPEFSLAERYYADVNVGGTTPLIGWADCGSQYRYENPHMVSETERWHIPEDSTGVVTGIGPYQPGAYHQWLPSIILIGPSCEDGNTVYTEHHTQDGEDDIDINLCNVYSDWTDCCGELTMSEYTTWGWIARDPRSWPTVTSAFVASIRYGNVITVHLENDFGYGPMVVDGDTIMTPFITGWVPGSEHILEAVDPIEYGAIRYVFDHWSDGGERVHSVVVTTLDTTFTAYFNREYYLDIISDYGSPYGEGWYAEGGYATFGVDSIDVTGTIRYIFQGWTGTGDGSYTGPDASHTVVMNNPIVEEADWLTQYYLEVTYTGCDTLIPSQSGEGWYDAGALAPIATQELCWDTRDSVRYIFDHWESDPDGGFFVSEFADTTGLLMDQPYVATAVYKPQYRFVVYNPTGNDDPVPPVGTYWYDEGDTVTGSVTSPAGDVFCIGYDGTGSLPDGTRPSFWFEIYEPSSVTWLWGDMFFIEVIDTTEWLVQAAHGVPPGPTGTDAETTYFAPGTRVDCYVDSIYDLGSLGMRFTCTGWEGTGSVPASGTDNNFTIPSIMENSSLIWQWSVEDKFTVTGENIITHETLEIGSPVPDYGEYWYSAGTEVSGYVEERIVWHDGVRYFLGGYTGTGSLPSGYDSTFTFEIGAPSSVTWLWIPEGEVESLTVISPYCAEGCVPPVGVSYYIRGSVITAWTSVSCDIYPDCMRAVCTGWTGTGPVPPSGTGYYTDPFVMDSSGSITWNWRREYRLLINNPGDHDAPFPPEGEHWYAEGVTVSGFVNSPDSSGDTTYYCTGFDYTGRCLTGPTDTTAFSYVATCCVELTWNWTAELLPLIVISDYGSPVPAGTTYYPPGTEITAYVITPVDGESDGIRYVCTGWIGSGSVPETGSTPSVNFEIYDTTVIEWQWQRQIRLDISQNIPGDAIDTPIPPLGEHWYDDGSEVYGNVTSEPVVVGTDTFVCTGHIITVGTAAPDTSPQAEFEITLSEPTQIEWQWHNIDSCVTLTVISPYGSPDPYGTTWWLIGTTVDATVDSFVWVSGVRYVCTGWRGTGSVPSTGTGNRTAFVIYENSTLIWEWTCNPSFTVNNPAGYGAPEPDVGTYYYPVGTVVSGAMHDNPYITGSDTFYCIGYYGTGNLPAVSPQTDFTFTITENTSITWRWADEAVSLTVISPYGSPHPYGTTWWVPGSDVHAEVDEYVTIGGYRYVCTGWTGTGSVPSSGDDNEVDFVIWENSTLTWEWSSLLRMVISNPGGHDAPDPPEGTYWYQYGDTVSGEITENPSGDYACIGYVGTGSAPSSSPQTEFSFVIYEPSSITWRWAPLDSVARLIVISDYDSPHPYGTTYWYIGSEVNAYVDSAVVMDTTYRVRCTGWAGEGSVPDSGDVNWVNFVIWENSTLIWNWEEQYYINLTYTGCRGAVPEQRGEGWYALDDTAWIETETPVYDGPACYGFVRWQTDGSRVPIDDSLSASTFVRVDCPHTLTAIYAPAVHAVVQKDPEEDDVGSIFVDGEWYDSTYAMSFWWGNGSYHDIGVSTPDSALDAVYNFDHWSDDGDTIHRVGPIISDTVLTAYYNTNYLCVVGKNPPEPFGWIKIDRVLYDTTGTVLAWWAVGSVHELEVSTPDISDTTVYIFRQWMDGTTEPVDTTPPIRGSDYFIAEYDKKYRIKIQKQPPHPYGYILFDDTLYYDESELTFWVDSLATHTIGVSKYDIDTTFPESTSAVSAESVYTFIRWSDAGALVHSIGPITEGGVYTAWYSVDEAVLSFELSSMHWYIGDVVNNQTVTMPDTAMIGVTNTGNLPIDLGLVVFDVNPRVWEPGRVQGYNRFVLRAIFNDETTHPASFGEVSDFLKREITWANATFFGPGGFAIEPAPSLESTENLWMQFIAPFCSSVIGEVVVTVKMYAKPHLP
ncbi:hypothetical protein J7K18_02535 [bacterium]|nr:hypothetical protein [bacterium]